MYKLLLILISISVFGQTSDKIKPDVRNVNWGMTITEVENLELVKKVIKKDTIIIDKGVTQLLIVPNLIINKTKTQIIYSFSNNKLISVDYIFNNDTTEHHKLFTSVVKLTSIYNNLISNKKMESLYCWSYDSDSYKQLSGGKKACSFTNKEELNSVEEIAISNKQVSEILYSVSNNRTIATFIFDIKSNYNNIRMEFIPSNTIKEQIKNSSF